MANRLATVNQLLMCYAASRYQDGAEALREELSAEIHDIVKGLNNDSLSDLLPEGVELHEAKFDVVTMSEAVVLPAGEAPHADVVLLRFFEDLVVELRYVFGLNVHLSPKKAAMECYKQCEHNINRLPIRGTGAIGVTRNEERPVLRLVDSEKG